MSQLKESDDDESTDNFFPLLRRTHGDRLKYDDEGLPPLFTYPIAYKHEKDITFKEAYPKYKPIEMDMGFNVHSERRCHIESFNLSETFNPTLSWKQLLNENMQNYYYKHHLKSNFNGTKLNNIHDFYMKPTLMNEGSYKIFHSFVSSPWTQFK